jgi:tetratricopeptide (TPR) repeat protein
MAKEPSRRYQSAREMADDLRRFLAHEPILARPVGKLERGWRWCLRNPLVAGLSAAVLLVLVTGIAISSMFAVEAHRREREALDQQARADANAREAKANADRAMQEEAKANREADRATREADAANAAAEFMTSIFQTSDTVGLAGLGLRREGEEPHQLTLEQVLRRGSERIRTELKDQPLLQARLMSTLGNINRSLGFYQEAEPLLKESLAIRERHLIGSSDRADQLALADSQFNLAWLLHDLGSYPAAEPLYRKALAARSAQFDETHSLVTTTKFNLAWLLVDSNQHAEAERLFREVLDIRRKSLPAGHRDVYLAEMGLAAMLWTQGKHAEIIKQTLPTLSGDVLLKVVSLYELARIQRQLRNFAPAVKLYESIIKTAREVLPPQHPLLAAVLVDLAGLLKEQGDYPAAEDAMREALNIIRATMGGHPKLIEPLREFAVQLTARGDFDEAEQWNREALRIALQRHPSSKNVHIEFMWRVGDALRQGGRLDAAKAILEESLQVKPDRNDPVFHGTLHILARTYADSGDWTRAQALYQQLLNEPAHRESAGLRLELRDCNLDLGQLDAAGQLLNAVQGFLDPLDPKSGHRLDTLRNIAEHYAAMDQFERAVAFARELVERAVRQWPVDHPELVRDQDLLARTLLQLQMVSASLPAGQDAGRMSDVEKLLAANERICRRLGGDHPWLAQNAQARAELAAVRGDAAAALGLGEEAVRILASRFAEDHPWLLKARHELAVHQRRAGQLQAAAESLRKLLDERKRVLPPLHADVFETMLDLAATVKESGDLAAAEDSLRHLLAELTGQVAPTSRRIARAETLLGSVLVAEKKFDEAEKVLTDSSATLAGIYGENDGRVRQVRQLQVELYDAWGKQERAAEFRQRLSEATRAN